MGTGKTTLLLLMLPLFLSASAMALAADWDGDTSTVWDNADNWVGGTTPTDGSDINIDHVEADPPYSPVITSTTTNTSLSNSTLYIGKTSGSDSGLTITDAGTLQTSWGLWGMIPEAWAGSRSPVRARPGRIPTM